MRAEDKAGEFESQRKKGGRGVGLSLPAIHKHGDVCAARAYGRNLSATLKPRYRPASFCSMSGTERTWNSGSIVFASDSAFSYSARDSSARPVAASTSPISIL